VVRRGDDAARGEQAARSGGRWEQVGAGDGGDLVVRDGRRGVGWLSRWERDGLTSRGWRFLVRRWRMLRRWLVAGAKIVHVPGSELMACR